LITDTHAHLNHPDLRNNINDIISRAADAGIRYIIIPATDYKSSVEITELVLRHEMLYGAVGIHPSEVMHFREDHLKKIEELASENKIVAIGEIGLDFYWEPYDKELQKYVLEAQLDIAVSRNLPVILHNREASEELMNIISDRKYNRKLKAQFHSFSGSLMMAEECIKLGHYVSFTGNITYKPKPGSQNLIAVVRYVPLDNLLLETDSPYLSPSPMRGKVNEPSYIKHILNKISEIRQLPATEIEIKTWHNSIHFFRLKDK
jgi:TatD DNase family protein